jgi:hypothetical protein
VNAPTVNYSMPDGVGRGQVLDCAEGRHQSHLVVREGTVVADGAVRKPDREAAPFEADGGDLAHGESRRVAIRKAKERELEGRRARVDREDRMISGHRVLVQGEDHFQSRISGMSSKCSRV